MNMGNVDKEIPMTYSEKMAANKRNHDIRKAHNIFANMNVDFENDLDRGGINPIALVPASDHVFLMNVFQNSYPIEFENHMNYYATQGVELSWGSQFDTKDGPVVDATLKII